jgi:hypothetical protein
MRFCRPVVALLAFACVALCALPASAGILIEIDKSSQRMTVFQDGVQLYHWPVSTGLRAYDTPAGNFTPFRMEKDHFSREWDDAPMPYSIFFTTKGHAIHGTEHTRNIGRPASHGCVRLQPQNARMLFDLVKRTGMANTRVVLTGTVPNISSPAVARRAPGYDDDMGDPLSPRRVERVYPRDDRPLYWQQGTRPPFFDEDTPYRRMPPPGRYIDPRYGLY